MSDDIRDGGDAAAGRHPADDAAAPSWRPRAAPWERWQPAPEAPEVPQGPVEDGVVEDPEPTGSHATGELTVAELIARLGGTETPGAPPAAPRRRRNVPPREAPAARRPTPPPPQAPAARRPTPPPPQAPATRRPTPPPAGPAGPAGPPNPTDECDTEVFRAAAVRSELPDLDRIAAATPPRRARPAARKPRHRILLAGRSAAALIAVLSLTLTGAAWQWSTSKNHSLNKIAALDPGSADIVDPTGQYGDENFLIVGVDSREGSNSEVGAGGIGDAEGARSDSIILVNIPASRQRVVAVSFPRDLAITPMYCEAWNSVTGEYGPVYDEHEGLWSEEWRYTTTKLNSTFALGGPKCLVKTIQKLSGLNINRFIAVDFAGFAKVVDELGGVEVCTTTPLEDYELGTVLPHAGHQVINGETALNYVRARQVTTEFNGDYGRIKRQQLFLSSMLRSLISNNTFFSLKKLNNIVNMFIADSYVDNVKTRDLVELGQSVQGISAGHISFITIPTDETDENGDEPPRINDVDALFTAIIDDEPLPGEAATPTPAPGQTPGANNHVEAMAMPPASVTVQVSNSTEQSGLASKASDALESFGFETLTPNDYAIGLETTTVFFSPGSERAAVTVASAFPGALVKRDTGKGRVVQVVLGNDYRTTVPPAAVGSPVSVPLSRASMSPPTELPEDLSVTNAADTTCE